MSSGVRESYGRGYFREKAMPECETIQDIFRLSSPGVQWKHSLQGMFRRRVRLPLFPLQEETTMV
jgi:hypothetical protein